MNKKINQSPTKTKVQSKLPISVPKKSQIIKQEELKPDPIKLTDKQDKNTFWLISFLIRIPGNCHTLRSN